MNEHQSTNKSDLGLKLEKQRSEMVSLSLGNEVGSNLVKERGDAEEQEEVKKETPVDY